jgi:hypothetical protein
MKKLFGELDNDASREHNIPIQFPEGGIRRIIFRRKKNLDPCLTVVFLVLCWLYLPQESEYYPVAEAGTELPYCTICLERMDESVSTVLTILCNHKATSFVVIFFSSFERELKKKDSSFLKVEA